MAEEGAREMVEVEMREEGGRGEGQVILLNQKNKEEENHKNLRQKC